SPFTAGWVFVIASGTEAGNSTPIGGPRCIAPCAAAPSASHPPPPPALPDDLGRDGDLLVRRHVHERQRLAVAIQVLHVLALDDREADLDAGVEGALHDRAGLDVAELGADERATLARLDVLELDHLEQRAVELERHAVLQVVGGHAHSTISSLVARGISRRPSAVTSTMSSIRTPPSPGMYTPGSIVTTI